MWILILRYEKKSPFFFIRSLKNTQKTYKRKKRKGKKKKKREEKLTPLQRTKNKKQ